MAPESAAGGSGVGAPGWERELGELWGAPGVRGAAGYGMLWGMGTQGYGTRWAMGCYRTWGNLGLWGVLGYRMLWVPQSIACPGLWDAIECGVLRATV